MPFTKLQFRPGINRETTSYTNEGGWFDMDKVRFRFGYPEKIGGWIKQSSTNFLGTCRALHPWVALDGTSYIGVGTHLKYYINEGGGYSDITPIRATTSAGDVTFTANANTLGADVAIIDTDITLTSSTGFPDSGRIKINDEIITYASISGNILTGCTRGVKRILRQQRTHLVMQLHVQHCLFLTQIMTRWKMILLRSQERQLLAMQ